MLETPLNLKVLSYNGVQIDNIPDNQQETNRHMGLAQPLPMP